MSRRTRQVGNSCSAFAHACSQLLQFPEPGELFPHCSPWVLVGSVFLGSHQTSYAGSSNWDGNWDLQSLCTQVHEPLALLLKPRGRILSPAFIIGSFFLIL